MVQELDELEKYARDTENKEEGIDDNTRNKLNQNEQYGGEDNGNEENEINDGQKNESEKVPEFTHKQIELLSIKNAYQRAMFELDYLVLEKRNAELNLKEIDLREEEAKLKAEELRLTYNEKLKEKKIDYDDMPTGQIMDEEDFKRLNRLDKRG